MQLAHAFRQDGHELYVVGGWVRDALLRRPHVDLDFSTDAPPERTLAILRRFTDRVWAQGMRFGTVGGEIDGIAFEITTFRSESYGPDSRHPEVAFVGDVVTDLARRDFTVNAMAVRLPEREAIDPFGGREHLRERRLMTPIAPEESFLDDPLRMLRAFRFVSQLEFRIDPAVEDTITELKDRLTTVSAERIRDELVRLMVGPAPAEALERAEATGLAGLFLPELSALKLEQDPVHRHKDVFRHTLAVVERTDPVRELRLAALLHDIGKPRTRRIGPEGVSFHHHEVVGAQMAKTRLTALRFPNDMVNTVSEIIRLHHRFHTYRLGWTDAAVRRYVRDAGPLLPLLNALVRADCTTRNPAKAKRLADRMDELERRIAELAAREELARLRPELDGHEVMQILGAPPGPVVGEALAYLLDLRLDEGELGKEEARRRLLEWAHERGIPPRLPGPESGPAPG